MPVLQEIWTGLPWYAFAVMIACALISRFVVRPVMFAKVPDLCRNGSSAYFVIPIAAFVLTAFALALANQAAAEFLAMIGFCSIVVATIALLVDAFRREDSGDPERAETRPN